VCGGVCVCVCLAGGVLGWCVVGVVCLFKGFWCGGVCFVCGRVCVCVSGGVCVCVV